MNLGNDDERSSSFETEEVAGRPRVLVVSVRADDDGYRGALGIAASLTRAASVTVAHSGDRDLNQMIAAADVFVALDPSFLRAITARVAGRGDKPFAQCGRVTDRVRLMQALRDSPSIRARWIRGPGGLRRVQNEVVALSAP